MPRSYAEQMYFEELERQRRQMEADRRAAQVAALEERDRNDQLQREWANHQAKYNQMANSSAAQAAGNMVANAPSSIEQSVMQAAFPYVQKQKPSTEEIFAQASQINPNQKSAEPEPVVQINPYTSALDQYMLMRNLFKKDDKQKEQTTPRQSALQVANVPDGGIQQPNYASKNPVIPQPDANQTYTPQEELQIADINVKTLPKKEQESLKSVAKKQQEAYQIPLFDASNIDNLDNYNVMLEKAQKEQEMVKERDEFQQRNNLTDQQMNNFLYYQQMLNDKEKNDKVRTDIRNSLHEGSGAQQTGNALALNALSIMNSPYRGVQAIAGNVAQRVLGNRPEGFGIQTSGAPYDYQNFSQAVQEETGNRIAETGAGEVGRFLYNTGVSAAESAYNMALTGMAGSAIGGAVEGAEALKTAQQVLQNASLLPFGANAYASTYQEARQRGLDDRSAALTATVSGAAEIITEKVSLDSLWDMARGNKRFARNAIVNALAQAGIEGSEEVASDLINAVADRIINGDKSEYEQDVQSIMMQNGGDEEDARRQATRNFIKDVGMSFLGGAISGGVMGGAATAVGTVSTQAQANQMYDQNTDYAELADSIDTNRDSYENKSAYQSALKAQEKAVELDQKQKNGETITNKDKRNLYTNMMDAVQVEAETRENTTKQEETTTKPEETTTNTQLPKEDTTPDTTTETTAPTTEKAAPTTKQEAPTTAPVEEKVIDNEQENVTSEQYSPQNEPESNITEENNVTSDVPEQYRATYVNDTELADQLQNAKNPQELVEAYQNAVDTRQGNEHELTMAKGYYDTYALKMAKAKTNNYTLEDIAKAAETTLSTQRAYEAGLNEQQIDKSVLSSSAQQAYNDGLQSALVARERNVSVQQNRMKQLANGYMTDISRRAFIERYIPGMNADIYKKSFDMAYNAGRQVDTFTVPGADAQQAIEKSWDDFAKKNSIIFSQLSVDQAKGIFSEGMTTAMRDRQAAIARSNMEKLTAVKGNGTFTDLRTNPTNDASTRVIAGAARLFGLNIELRDNIEGGSNGYYDAKRGTIVLNASSGKTLVTLAHELGEFTDAFNTEEFQPLVQSGMQTLNEILGEKEYQKMRRAYEDAYVAEFLNEKRKKTDADLDKEIFCDNIFTILGSEEGMNNLISKIDQNCTVQQAKTIKEKLSEMIGKVIDAFKSIISSGKLNKWQQAAAEDSAKRMQDLQDRLTTAMAKAVENYRGSEKTTEGETYIAASRNSNSEHYGLPVVISNDEMNQNILAVHDMKSVGTVIFENDLPVTESLQENADTLLDHFNEIGFMVMDSAAGEVAVTTRGVKELLTHSTPVEVIEGINMVPVVLKNGKIVSGRNGENGNRRTGIAIAAPVTFSNNSNSGHKAGDYYAIVGLERTHANDGIHQKLHVTDYQIKKADGHRKTSSEENLRGQFSAHPHQLRLILDAINDGVKIHPESNESKRFSNNVEAKDESIRNAFVYADDGRLALQNPKELSTEQWNTIAKEFNRLGYDIGTGKNAKEFYSNIAEENKRAGREVGYILRDDMAAALTKAFKIGDDSQLTPQQDNTAKNKQYATKAARHFGTTNRFDLAGYLTINGSLLDFSEGQGMRVQDHREISEILDLPDDAGYSDGLIEFMNQGNIRMQSYGIDISVAPNKAQRKVLARFFDSLGGEVAVDFSREDGSTAGSAEYKEGTSYRRILNDIDKYFETGEIPEGNANDSFRWSREVNSEGTRLTKDQQEYFKDSKVRTEDGSLKVMYHGTQNQFTVFDFSQGGKNGTAEGFGIYLTDNPEVSQSYGDRIIKGYANITKPAYSDRRTIKRNELAKLIRETVSIEAQRWLNDYDGDIKAAEKDTWISNYTYTYDKSISAAINEVTDSILDMNDNDMDIIQEVMSGMAIRDYNRAVEFYDALTRITGYDGFVTNWTNDENGTSSLIALAFRSNQIKNVDNLTPTSDPDIRRSVNVNTKDELDYYGLNTASKDYVKVQKAVRNKLKADKFFEDNNDLVNEESGIHMAITPKGINETFNHNNYTAINAERREIKIALIRYLPEMYREAHLVNPDAKNYHGSDRSNYIYFQDRIIANGKDIIVDIQVKKGNEGNRFYLHHVNFIEKDSDDLYLRENDLPATEASSESNDRISQSDQNATVKVDNHQVKTDAPADIAIDDTRKSLEVLDSDKDNVVTISSLKGDPTVFFTGTDEEIAAYEAEENAAIDQWKSIIDAPDFVAFQVDLSRGRTKILSPSVRGGLYQLSNLWNGEPVSHQLFGEEKGSEGENYWHPMKDLYSELVDLNRHHDVEVKVLKRKTVDSLNDLRRSMDAPEVDFTEMITSKNDDNADSGIGNVLAEGSRILKGQQVDQQMVRKIARKLTRKYGSKADINQFADDISRVFAYAQSHDIASADSEELAKIMTEVAMPVIKEAQGESNEELKKQIRKNVSGLKLDLSEQQHKEVVYKYHSYQNYKQAMRKHGIEISANGASMDGSWGEIVDKMMGTLTYAENEGNEPIMLLDALNSLDQKIVQNGFGMNNPEAAKDLAMDVIAAYYDEMGKQQTSRKGVKDKDIADLKKQVAEARKIADDYKQQIKKEYEERYDEALKDLKQARQLASEETMLQVAALRAQNRHDIQRRLDAQEKAKQKSEIQKGSRQLLNMLANPTNAKHVPISLEAPVLDLLSSIDFVGPKIDKLSDGRYQTKVLVTTEEQGQLRRRFETYVGDTYQDVMRQYQEAMQSGAGSKAQRTWQQKLSTVKDLYSRAGTEGNSNSATDLLEMLDKSLLPDLQKILDDNDGLKTISSLSADELKTINKAIKNITTAINKIDKFYTSPESVSKLGNDIMEHAKKVMDTNVRSRARETLKDFFTLDNATPETYFHGLGKSGEKVFRMLTRANNVKARDIRIAQEYMADLLKDVKQSEIDSMTGEKAKIIYEEGSMKLDVGDVMYLYMLLKRQDAESHKYGGFEMDDKEIKGKVYRDTKPHFLDEKKLRDITDKLTPKQKEIAEKMQQFLAVNCSEWGNETAILLYGYEKFTDPNYIPMTVDKKTVRTNAQNSAEGMINSIRESGFTKNVVPNANNPLIIRNIFDVFSEHVTNMAAYHAYAAPLTDVIRWNNYKTTEEIEEGDAKFGRQHTVKEAIDDIFGKGGQSYLVQLVRDINQMEKQTKVGTARFGSALTSRYKAAATLANLRVVAQQPTAWFRAGEMIDAKYLAAGLAPNKVADKMQAETSDISWIKSQGNIDGYITHSMKKTITRASSTREKINDAAGWLASKADDVTWNKLYRAVYAEQAAKYDGDLNSEEFARKVNDRFDEVIARTQVVDGTLMRSQLMRSSDRKNVSVSAFMAEPTKSYNMFLRDYIDITQGKREGKKIRPADLKHLSRTAAVYLVTNVANAVMQSIFDAERDDDDDKSYIEKLLNAFGINTDSEATFKDKALTFLEGNFMDDLNMLNNIPIINDMYEMVWSAVKKTVWGENTYTSSSSDFDVAGLNELVKAWNYTFNKGEKSKITLYGTIAQDVKALSQVSGIPVYNLMRECVALYNTMNDLWGGENIRKTDQAKTEMVAPVIKDIKKGADYTESLNKALERGASYDDVYNQIRNEYKQQYIDLMEAGKTKEAQTLEEKVEGIYADLKKKEGKDYKPRVKGWYTDFLKEDGRDPVEAVFKSLDTGSDYKKAIEEAVSLGKTYDSIESSVTKQYKQQYIDLMRQGKRSEATKLENRLVTIYNYLNDKEGQKPTNNARIQKWYTDWQKENGVEQIKLTGGSESSGSRMINMTNVESMDVPISEEPANIWGNAYVTRQPRSTSYWTSGSSDWEREHHTNAARMIQEAFAHGYDPNQRYENDFKRNSEWHMKQINKRHYARKKTYGSGGGNAVAWKSPD